MITVLPIIRMLKADSNRFKEDKVFKDKDKVVSNRDHLGLK